MARINITVNTALVMDTALGGTPDTTLKAWFDFAKGQRNVDAATFSDTGKSTLEINSDDTTMAPLNYLLSQGGDVENAPVFIKMSTATYGGEVPDGINNRVDPSDSSVRLWSDWKDSNHNHMDAADGDKIVPGNSWGDELSSNELKVLLGLGYTMYLAHEVPPLLP